MSVHGASCFCWLFYRHCTTWTKRAAGGCCHRMKSNAIWAHSGFPRHSLVGDIMQSRTVALVYRLPGLRSYPRTVVGSWNTSIILTAEVSSSSSIHTVKPTQTFAHKLLNITSGARNNLVIICNALGCMPTILHSSRWLAPDVHGVLSWNGFEKNLMVLCAAAARSRLPMYTIFNHPSLREGNYFHAFASYASSHEGYTAFKILQRAWSDHECRATRNATRLCPSKPGRRRNRKKIVWRDRKEKKKRHRRGELKRLEAKRRNLDSSLEWPCVLSLYYLI